MALVANKENLFIRDLAEFNLVLTPGTPAPRSGIYRCEGCGDEVACNRNQPLPTQNTSQHSALQGAIRWRLLVATQQI